MKGAVLPFESVDEILRCDHSKATEQYLLVVLFILFIIQGCSTFQFPRERYCLGLSYGFVKYFDKS